MAAEEGRGGASYWYVEKWCVGVQKRYPPPQSVSEDTLIRRRFRLESMGRASGHKFARKTNNKRLRVFFCSISRHSRTCHIGRQIIKHPRVNISVVSYLFLPSLYSACNREPPPDVT